MQAILSNPIHNIRKQLAGNYWAGIFLNGAAPLFLDEEQVNLIKVMLTMVLPVAMIYMQLKVSELNALLRLAAKAVSSGAFCHQGFCS